VPNVRQKQFHIVSKMSERLFDASGVQIWHSAASLALRIAHLNVVFLKRADGGLADPRLVVIDDAGVEERDLQTARALRSERGLTNVLPEPPLESLGMEVRENLVAVDADGLLHQQAVGGITVGEI